MGFRRQAPRKDKEGVHKHARGYLVYFQDDHRTKRAKLVKGTIDDVMAFKADPSSWDGNDDDDDEEDEHDDDADTLESA